MAITVPALGVPGTVPLGRRLSWGLSDIAALTRRNLLHLTRVPALLFFTAIQPIMFTLLFRYVFGGAIRTSAGQYVEFLLPGIIVQTGAFLSFATAVGLAEELSKGVIDRFRSMPIARSAVLVARLVSDTLRTFMTVLIIIGVGYGVGFRFHTGFGQIIAMILLSTGFGLAMACISSFIGLAIKDQEAVQAFGLVWVFPLTFASGVFVPVETMPAWLAAFARNNPVTIIAEAARHLALGTPAGNSVWLSVVWLAAIILTFGALAVRAYRRID